MKDSKAKPIQIIVERGEVVDIQHHSGRVVSVFVAINIDIIIIITTIIIFIIIKIRY